MGVKIDCPKCKASIEVQEIHSPEEARLHLVAAELPETLKEISMLVESFYTATRTNAKSRDDNRDIKNHVLGILNNAIAKTEGLI